MATLTRWTPVREAFRIQDELNRLFGAGFRNLPLESEALATGWTPPVDIYEDGEGLTLKVEVPGFASGDIDLRVENSTLSLKGERKLKEDKRDNYQRIERFYGTFSRSFSLPPSVDTDKVRADAKNGVLTIFLPKREETKPKQIRVNVQG